MSYASFLNPEKEYSKMEYNDHASTQGKGNAIWISSDAWGAGTRCPTPQEGVPDVELGLLGTLEFVCRAIFPGLFLASCSELV